MSNITKILTLGGVYAALRLDKTLARHADVEVTLVSSNNFYPQLAPQDVRVVLVQPGEFVLPELGEKAQSLRAPEAGRARRGGPLGTKVTGFLNSLGPFATQSRREARDGKLR